MSAPRVLVTGAAGILGDALLRRLPNATGTVHAADSPHASLRADLRLAADARRVVASSAPDVVVHTVALTDVDRCEREPGAAFDLSALTTRNLAGAVADLHPSALLVYVSTDQVYSGAGPHREGSTRPTTVYGQAKRAGELAALAAPRALVLRTCFLGRSGGARGSYSDWVAATLRAGETIRVDPRARFSALHLDQLVDVIERCVSGGLTGVFNAGTHDGAAKLDVVREVGRLVGAAPHAVVAAPDARPAGRPADLRLDVSRLESELGSPLPTAAAMLARLALDYEEDRRAHAA